MSGGYFDHREYTILDIADNIEELIDRNDNDGGYGFSSRTIGKFREAVRLLRRSMTIIHRIDWLLSGDDSESSFLDRLERDENDSQLP